jgi:hypothetical protein
MFSTEFLFTTIAVIFCFLIYVKTKESYELTKYAGIKYFRDAFLFLGLSYLLTFVSKITFDFILNEEAFMPLFIMLLSYFSTIGIFNLILSSTWKKFNNRNFLVLGNCAAITLSIVSFITRSPLMLLYMQLALLAILVLLILAMPKERKRLSQVKMLYLLVTGLWLINLLVADRMRPFPLEIELFFKVISIVVFAAVYYKISKWVK